MKQVKLLKEIKLHCRKGMNRGKELGIVKYYENQEPYYYFTRRNASDQLFRLPKYRNLLPISTTILDDLKKLNVNKIIGYLCLGGDSFWVVATRTDFEKGELLSFDDSQRALDMTKLMRHYVFPTTLQESLENE